MDRGSLSVSGGSTLTGLSDVTIILTSSTGTGYATASVNGGSTVTLNAPTSGPLSGLAVYQDRNAPQSGSSSFAGGTGQKITGAIYLPNQPVTFNGGTNTGGARCTQLVALTITFNGNAAFNNNCQGAGVRNVGSSYVQLVE
jgi:hypothetical protein